MATSLSNSDHFTSDAVLDLAYELPCNEGSTFNLYLGSIFWMREDIPIAKHAVRNTMYRLYALLEGRGACADLQKPIRMLCKVVVLSRDGSAHPAISATTRKALRKPSDRLQ